MSIFRVVLTGGPCAGKTTIASAIKKHYGPQIDSVPEVATNALAIFPKPGPDPQMWNDAFQAAVMHFQSNLEETYIQHALENEARLVLFDRGLGDGPGYIDGDGWRYFKENFNLTKEDVYSRYDQIIHLESLAVADPDLYEQLKATNPSRYETAWQAVIRDTAIKESWNDHPNWVCISSALGLGQKISQVIRLLDKFLATERERKFVLFKLPENLGEGKTIRQGYFSTQNEMRLRQLGDHYYITFKSEGDEERQEAELQIPEWVFENYWAETAGARIHKTRYYVPYGSLTLEIDAYHEELEGLITLECEFSTQAEADNFVIPPEYPNTLEVTQFPEFKNRQLARNGLPGRLLEILKRG